MRWSVPKHSFLNQLRAWFSPGSLRRTGSGPLPTHAVSMSPGNCSSRYIGTFTMRRSSPQGISA